MSHLIKCSIQPTRLSYGFLLLILILAGGNLPAANGSVIIVEEERVEDRRLAESGARLIRWENLTSGQTLNISRIQSVNQLFQVEDKFEVVSPDTFFTSITLPLNSPFSLSANGVSVSFESMPSMNEVQFAPLFGSSVTSFTLRRTVFIPHPFSDTPGASGSVLSPDGNPITLTLVEGPVFISPYFPVELEFNQSNADVLLVQKVRAVAIPEPRTFALAIVAGAFLLYQRRQRR